MKRGKVDKQEESLVARDIGTCGVSNPGLQMIGSNECDVSCLYGTRGLIPEYRRIPAIILRLKKSLGSWNLVNPLLSMNEAWIHECACQITTPGRSI